MNLQSSDTPLGTHTHQNTTVPEPSKERKGKTKKKMLTCDIGPRFPVFRIGGCYTKKEMMSPASPSYLTTKNGNKNGSGDDRNAKTRHPKRKKKTYRNPRHATRPDLALLRERLIVGPVHHARRQRVTRNILHLAPDGERAP